ncbi:MAG TPA: hypothetical protein VGO81_17255, partial [Solirubrobacteraceae bacterium]|nr:hypothetical protein [Solirubrobacteraceae bacterium]
MISRWLQVTARSVRERLRGPRIRVDRRSPGSSDDMSIQEGTHKIGPENGTVTIKTGREGAAAKAGHDLTLEATSWEGTLELGDNPSVKITIDPASIEVRKGEGGAKALDDGDKADIKKSMKKDILGSDQISFESSDVKVDNGSMNVSG